MLVGLGAAGSIAAHVLTQAGLRVVAVEAGPRRRRDEMMLDEIRNEIDHWLGAPKSAGEVPTFRADTGTPAVRSPYPTLMVNAAGGSALHYPGTSPRLFPWNFCARTRTLERYGIAAIPSDSTLVDWPLGYGELEPYYALVEHAIGISGEAGSNPFEGPRSCADPRPPLRRTGWTELMSDAAGRLGWHPYPDSDRHQLRALQRQPCLHVLRFLREQRLPQRGQGVARQHRAATGRGDGESSPHYVRPGDPGRGGSRRSRHGRRLREERAGARPASGGRDARRTHIRERPVDAVVQVGRTSGRAREQAWSGRARVHASTSIRRCLGFSRLWISRFLPARGLRGSASTTGTVTTSTTRGLASSRAECSWWHTSC